jgi:hypothetical protein
VPHIQSAGKGTHPELLADVLRGGCRPFDILVADQQIGARFGKSSRNDISNAAGTTSNNRMPPDQRNELLYTSPG